MYKYLKLYQINVQAFLSSRQGSSSFRSIYEIRVNVNIYWRVLLCSLTMIAFTVVHLPILTLTILRSFTFSSSRTICHATFSRRVIIYLRQQRRAGIVTKGMFITMIYYVKRFGKLKNMNTVKILKDLILRNFVKIWTNRIIWLKYIKKHVGRYFFQNKCIFNFLFRFKHVIAYGQVELIQYITVTLTIHVVYRNAYVDSNVA